MTVFIIFLFFSFARAQGDDPVCNPIGDACSMENPDVLRISCTEAQTQVEKSLAGELSCECTDVYTNACADSGADAAPSPVNAEKCKEYCETHASQPSGEIACKFWRWEQLSSTTTCDLSSTCEEANACFAPPCEAGEIGCDSGVPETTTLPSTDPVPDDAKSCPGKIGYNAANVHWQCFCFNDCQGGATDVNIYADEEIPVGAVCHTMSSCPAWVENQENSNYPNMLVVKCHGVDANTAGKWIPDQTTGNMNLTTEMCGEEGDGATLKEPNLQQDCASYSCADLQLVQEQLENKPGVTVYCETPLADDDWMMKEPNSCILLCDQHLTHSIACLPDEEGIKGWRDEVTDTDYVTGEEFTCTL